MTVLVFEDRGWTIATNSWSIGGKTGSNSTTIMYTWGADGISFFNSATGVAQVVFDLSPDQFVKLVQRQAINSIADLRGK